MGNIKVSQDFVFTQYSLETFRTCPMKFKMRYIDKIKWKDYSDSRALERMKTGSDFHLLAQRYFMGIDCDINKDCEIYEQLRRWIIALKENFKISPDIVYLPEYKLRLSLSNTILEANFDLLMIEKTKVQIWDWKTGNGSMINTSSQKRENLKKSFQTMVYMYVLKERGFLAAGRELECKDISMNYWQPDSCRILANIEYNQELHKKFEAILENEAEKILNYDFSSFDKLQYEKSCRKCEYRFFCNKKNGFYYRKSI